MPKRPAITTIQVTKETKLILERQGLKGEVFDHIIRRILSGQGDVWVDVLAVDDGGPEEHDVLIQLGNEPPRYYLFSHGNCGEVPRPTITVQKEAAKKRRKH